MRPDNFYFGGGATETALLPIVAILAVVTIGLVLALPRKYVVVPFILSAFLIPLQQQIVIGGVHFFILRVVLIFAWLRLLVTRLSSSSPLFGGRLRTFDNIFVFWALYHVFATLVTFECQGGSIVNQAGILLDTFGSYFLLRYLIRDKNDVVRVVKVFAIVAGLSAVSMLSEKFHNQNLFGYLGAHFIPQVRDGAIRAQGPFAHPILAGTFGAMLLPMFLYLWQIVKAKGLAAFGIFGSTVMTLTAASSTPLTAYVGGLFALCFWPMRRNMRKFRWGVVVLLLVLHVAMKAPVWFLIARVDLTGASSGYHRAMLIDTTVRHFSDWWLVGTTSNADWGFDMWDLSDQFVAEAVSGGVACFAAFIAMICICFGRIGKARRLVGGDANLEWLFWFLGASLFANIMGFFGISYFDHTQVAWFTLLVIINTVTSQPRVLQVGNWHPEEAISPLPLPNKGLGELEGATTFSSESRHWDLTMGK